MCNDGSHDADIQIKVAVGTTETAITRGTSSRDEHCHGEGTLVLVVLESNAQGALGKLQNGDVINNIRTLV